jgi:myosin heavy subunit
VAEFGPQQRHGLTLRATRRRATGARKSLIVQFKDQLSVLMTTLALTAPHFIRCIKPNKLLKAKVFQSPMVLEQLRYSGLLDVCKIRKKGYPVRKENGYFAWRYGVLLGRGTGKSKGVAKEVAEALERRGLLKQLEWRIGLTKVFLKSEAYERLELSREKAVGASATYIQAAARGRVHRNNFRQARALLKDLTAKTKAKDLEAVEALLLKTGELPYQGRHLKPVLDARQMMQKVLEERRAEVLLVEAIAGAELAILQSALQTCTQLGYNSPSVEKGKKLVQSLLEEQKVFDALVEAVKSRELAKLVAALVSLAGVVDGPRLTVARLF